MRKNFIKCVIAAAVLGVAPAAMAKGPSEFTATCQYDTPSFKGRCGSNIAHLVTQKFMDTFPMHKYWIGIQSDHMIQSDGALHVYAKAGVVKASSDGVPRLPGFSMSYFLYLDPLESAAYSPDEAGYFEMLGVREAVRGLMEDCERTKGCDIYTPYGVPRKTPK